MRKINQFILNLEKAIVILATVIFIACITLILVDRYVFKTGLVGMEELARYAMIWLAFIGGAYVLNQDGHIKMDLISTYITNQKLITFLRINASVLSLLFLIVYFVLSIHHLRDSAGISSPALGLPMIIAGLPLAVGSLLMIFHLFVHLFFSQRKGYENGNY